MKKLLVAMVLACAGAQVACADTITWTGKDPIDPTDWFRPGNWDLGRIPEDGDDVVFLSTAVSGAETKEAVLSQSTPHLKSLTLHTQSPSGSPLRRCYISVKGWETRIWADDIHLMKSGVIRPYAAFKDGNPSNRVWIVGNNMTLDEYSSNSDMEKSGCITATARGYIGSSGPSWVNNRWTSNFTAGGSYGGASAGADGGASKASVAYGDAEWPYQPGSSGGTTATAFSGGGAIFIDLSGDLVVNGGIVSNGSGTNGGQPSSGGGIVIKCRTVTGGQYGTISVAAGGEKGLSSERYGGGGGRVAIHYDSVAQAEVMADCKIKISAAGGCGGTVKPFSFVSTTGDGYSTLPGHAGTVWLTDDLFLTKSPIRVAGVWANASALQGDSVSFNSDLIFDNGLIEFPSAVTVTVNGSVRSKAGESHRYGFRFTEESTLNVAGDVWLEGSTITLDKGGAVNVGGDLVLTNATPTTFYKGGDLRLYSAKAGEMGEVGASLSVGGKLTLKAGTVVTTKAESTCGTVAKIEAKDVLIESKAGVNAVDRGYGQGEGPGKAYVTVGGYGASHGGKGAPAARTLDAYGNKKFPTAPGSGGILNGGGVIWIEATHRMDVEGTLAAYSSNPMSGQSSYQGGAGGSILLAAHVFASATGVLDVHGGNAMGGSGIAYGGGGGRIAVRADDDLSNRGETMTISVAGGTSGKTGDGGVIAETAAKGTVYWGPWHPGLMLLLK